MNERNGSPLWSESLMIPKNRLVQTPDEVRKGAYLIRSGLLRCFRLAENGKVFSLGLLGSGEVFGEWGELSLGARDMYIETVQDTSLLFWEEKAAAELLAKCPPLMQQMLVRLSERLLAREERLEKLAYDPVRDRVLHVLLQLCRQFGKEEGAYWKVSVPLSHQELANMVGATRETVSVALGHLVEEGVLRKSRLTFALHGSLFGGKRENGHAPSLRRVNTL